MKIIVRDSNGAKLKTGDLLKIQSRNSVFYTKMQVIKGSLYPFDQFAYDNIVKVESLPDRAVKSKTDDGVEFWYSNEVDQSCNRVQHWIMGSVIFKLLEERFYEVIDE